MYSKKRNCKCSISPIVKFIEWTLLHASVRQLRHSYSSKRKRKRKKIKTVERHFCLMFSCWFDIAGILKREKQKELFLKLHHYLFGRRILKFCYILDAPSCWNLLVVFFPQSICLLLHVSVSASYLFHKLPLTFYCLLKHYNRIWKSVYS